MDKAAKSSKKCELSKSLHEVSAKLQMEDWKYAQNVEQW